DVFSAPSCGTILPGKKIFHWGLAVNLIHKYKMEGAGNKIDLKSEQLFLTLAYGITERLVFDGKLGIGDIKNDRINNQEFDYRLGWGGGYGLRFKLYEDWEQKMKVILGAHHISIHPRSEELNSVKYKAILDDNQFDVLLAKEWNFGIPYLGIKVSRSRLLRRENNTDNSSFHSPWKIGAILGYDWEIKQNTFLNLEVRFIDETSFNAGISHKF
ncbi:MAG: PorT family protein, partial [Candidatus Omnitrophica bacterium]|nr:PorT family protein [Candidatus Omnitrophota bacterium]